MGYELDALLGPPAALCRPTGPPVFPLTAELGLLPLTSDVLERLAPVEAWARKASGGTRVARIGAEFFGGVGEHACTLWVDGVPEAIADINAVLARFGVVPAPPNDAFDTVGLGRFRSTEGWAAEAVVSQARDVAALLRDPRDYVRERAVARLGDLRVAAALRDEAYGVRLAACSALERLGEEGCRALQDALAAASVNDQLGLLHSLGRMGPASRGAAPRLLGLLEHEDWRIRLEAARTLGLIGAVEAKPALDARLADKEDLVRKAAQEALRLLS
jgi:HEAT repeat protein